MPGGWTGQRKNRKTPQATRLRQLTLARDGHRCQWAEHGRKCLAPADEADHVDPNGPDDLTNMRALCQIHHARKSSREGNAARWRYRQARPREAHPGLR